MVRDPKKELDELNKRKAELEESLSKREAELKELRSKKKSLLERQIRRAQVRINAKERKRRTRRLILLGSYLEHLTGDDPARRDRLRKDLDGFLERDRDRELFDLPSASRSGLLNLTGEVPSPSLRFSGSGDWLSQQDVFSLGLVLF